MDKIQLYEKRNVDLKGAVIFPEELRKFMKIGVGSKVAFIEAEKNGNEFVLKLKVIK